MAIRFTCHCCDEVYNVSDDLAGRKIRCRACQTVLQIPGGGGARSGDRPASAKKSTPPSARYDVDDDRPRRRRDEDDRPRRRRDEDYEDESPRRRGSKKSKAEKRSPALLIGISAGGVALIGLAIGVIAWANHKNSEVWTPRTVGTPPTLPMQMQARANTEPKKKPKDEDSTPESTTSASKSAPAAHGAAPVASSDDTGGDIGQRVYKRLLKSSVLIFTLGRRGNEIVPTTQGSGTLIDKQNKLVLTNYHVVGKESRVVVFFPTLDKNGRPVPEEEDFFKAAQKKRGVLRGKVLKREQEHDLALVELDHLPDGVEALPLATERPEVGNPVFSVGNPGAANGFFIYTHGQVRQLLRNQEMPVGDEEQVWLLHSDIVLTDSPTNPGDSGGPLVNRRAEMIGVTQSLNRKARSLSYFIDVSEVRKFLDRYTHASGMSVALANGPGILGTAEDLPGLVKDLTGTDVKARLAAATKLGERGPEAKLAIAPLLHCLKEKNPTLESFVRSALNKIGAPGESEVPTLLELLDDSNTSVRLATVEELALAGQSAHVALPGLAKLLTDRDTRIRRKAAEAVSKAGVTADDRDTIMPQLSKAIKDSDAQVRSAAALALAALPYGAEDVPMLSKYLAEQDPAVRTFAASGLAKVGPAAKDTVPALISAFNGAGNPLKAAIMQAFAGIGPDAQDAMPQVKEALGDGDMEVRRHAIAAVGVMGKAATGALPQLADAVKDARLRRDALAALQKLGHAARNATVVSAVVDLLSDKDIQNQAIETLQAIAPTDRSNAQMAAGALVPLFENKLISFRSKVSNALAAMGREAVTPLTQALSNADPSIRLGAADTLSQIGKPARTRNTVRELTRCARTDTIVAVRQACQSALYRIQAR